MASRLREDAMNLVGASKVDDEDDGDTLISDIRIRGERAAIAKRNGVMPDAAIVSKDLVDILTNMPEQPVWRVGAASPKPLSQKKLAIALADYRVRPNTVSEARSPSPAPICN